MDMTIATPPGVVNPSPGVRGSREAVWTSIFGGYPDPARDDGPSDTGSCSYRPRSLTRSTSSLVAHPRHERVRCRWQDALRVTHLGQCALQREAAQADRNHPTRIAILQGPRRHPAEPSPRSTAETIACVEPSPMTVWCLGSRSPRSARSRATLAAVPEPPSRTRNGCPASSSSATSPRWARGGWFLEPREGQVWTAPHLGCIEQAAKTSQGAPSQSLDFRGCRGAAVGSSYWGSGAIRGWGWLRKGAPTRRSPSALFISHRTASTHVANILGKLNLALAHGSCHLGCAARPRLNHERLSRQLRNASAPNLATKGLALPSQIWWRDDGQRWGNSRQSTPPIPWGARPSLHHKCGRVSISWRGVYYTWLSSASRYNLFLNRRDQLCALPPGDVVCCSAFRLSR